MSRYEIDDLPERLREIAQMDHVVCVEVLRAWSGITPQSRLRAPTLRRVLAYEIQTKALGGLSPKEQRGLKDIAGGKSAPKMKAVPASPGAHLVREWNGRTYRVEVTKEGYVLDRMTYRSLSAVAKRITGTAWSGPRFFGLTGKRSA